MDYQTFIALHAEEQVDYTLNAAKYAGTDNLGDNVYQIQDFWVIIRENAKGVYCEAEHNAPELIESGKQHEVRELDSNILNSKQVM